MFDFGVFGPFTVRHAGSLLSLGGAKQRTVLATLVVHVNRTVQLDDLIAELWEDRPPASAVANVRTYVGNLRRLLAAAAPGTADPVTRSGSGYLLTVAAAAVDGAVFEDRIRQGHLTSGRGDLDRAADHFEEARQLWQGPPMADLPGGRAIRSYRIRLEQARLAMLEDLAEVRIELGEPATAAALLREILGTEPLRERAHCLLLRALYCAGDVAGALQAYTEARRSMVDQLGIEPGAALREVHLAVLNDDWAALASRRTSRGPAVPAPARPAQLPLDVYGFTGRAKEIARLDAIAATASDRPTALVLSALWGTAGVGKTALAVHWAHRVAARYPDGQLYINLRGFDPAGRAMDPAEAIRRFLAALDVPAQRIPADLDALSALYRSQLADRRMLVLLDNARDAEQVRPLLPGTAGCLALVTSRNRLPGLVAGEGAHPLLLDLLSAEEAHELLAQRMDPERLTAEPDATQEIITACGRLPLALAIVAARAATDRLPLAILARDLRNSRRRLDALATGDRNADVRAVFSWSYRALAPEVARLFRLLGVVPGTSFPTAAAAALSGTSLDVAASEMAALASAHLVEQVGADRYRLHDLLRLYAHECGEADEDPGGRQEAVRRLADWYLAAAAAVNAVLTPRRTRVVPTPSFPRPDLPVPADAGQALAWPDEERQNLVEFIRSAAGAGPHDAAWQIPYLLWGYFAHHGQWADCVAMHRAAVAAAAHSPDPEVELISRGNLGLALVYTRELDEALEQQLLALRAAQERRRADLQSVSLDIIAFVYGSRHEYAEAAAVLREAIGLAEAADDLPQLAICLINLGQATAKLSRPEESIDLLTRALDLARRIGDASLEAYALTHIGETNLGRADQTALDYFQQAAERLHRLGDRSFEATARTGIGHARLNLGDPAAALPEFHRALALRRQTGEVHEEAAALTDIAQAHLDAGDRTATRRVLDEALALRRHAPDRHEQSRIDDLAARLEPRPAGRSGGDTGPAGRARY
jgi:DNA-binding SARP family transcriptional activator